MYCAAILASLCPVYLRQRLLQVREDVTEEFLRHSDEDDDEVLEVGDLSQGAKSLASIFESDDELIEVDAEQTDESLLVSAHAWVQAHCQATMTA